MLKKKIVGQIIFLAGVLFNISIATAAYPLHKHPVADVPTATNEVIYHVVFPFTDGQGAAETIPLSDDYRSMVVANLMAGVLYGHMVTEAYPGLHFDPDYLYGSVLGQLMQENSDLHHYPDASQHGNINEGDVYNQLLSPGQGGPYQINNYAIRMPDDTGVGMINYVALQHGLGYLIAQQSLYFPSVAQNLKTGPATLENIYYGPIAAAYFQFNDLVATFVVNTPSWGPEATTWPACSNNLKSASPPDFLDMLQNANYNAGLYSSIFVRFVQICSNMQTYGTAAANIDNYSLGDDAYNTTIGITPPSAGTFILYPRQVRFYLDELYSFSARLSQWLTVDNTAAPANQIPVSYLKTVFENEMTQLAHGTTSANYALITTQQADTAFDSAVTAKGVSPSATLNITTTADRNNFFGIVDTALSNLETTLNFKFTDTTENDLNTPYYITGLSSVPTDTGATITWSVNNDAGVSTMAGGLTLSGSKAPLQAATCSADKPTESDCTITVTGLEQKTTYNYLVANTTTGAPNTYVAMVPGSFTTGGSPSHSMSINSVSETDIDNTSVQLSWVVNYSGTMSSIVNSETYGVEGQTEQAGPTPTCTITGQTDACSVILASLTAATDYSYTLNAVAGSDSAQHKGSFTTAGGTGSSIKITMQAGYPTTTTTTAAFAWKVVSHNLTQALTNRFSFNGTGIAPNCTTISAEEMDCTADVGSLTASTTYPYEIDAISGTTSDHYADTVTTSTSGEVVGPTTYTWNPQPGPAPGQDWGVFTFGDASGGSAPYTYTVTISGATITQKADPQTYWVTGMTQGTTYTVTIVAHDAQGHSASPVSFPIKNDY